MIKQRRFSGEWMVGLALALVVLLGAPGFVQTARTAGAYNLSLETPQTVTQYQKVELAAVVRDSQGQPVDGVPVEFWVESGWEKNIVLSSQRPVTQKNGAARSTFQSDMTGVIRITAQVGDSATTAHIAVTGAGSTTTGGISRR